MEVAELRNVVIKNIREGMGKNYWSFYIFVLLSPIYMIYLFLLLVVIAPFIWLDSKLGAPDGGKQ